MRLVHHVLGLARREFLAGVDEQDVAPRLVRAALLAGAVEHQNGHRDARGREQVGGQPHYRVEQVFLDQRLADTPLGSAPEQNTMRDDHRDAARLALGDFDHVGDEAVVALGLRRDAAPEALELVGVRVLRTPTCRG